MINFQIIIKALPYSKGGRGQCLFEYWFWKNNKHKNSKKITPFGVFWEEGSSDGESNDPV